MKEVKCSCGHINHVGTAFCEACGKPFQNEDSNELLDMRYEGSARRSIVYKKTIIDKVWNFFSSVKVGVWLILLTLIASAVGTIFPQKMYIPPTIDPSEYYYLQYGTFGELYYQLGFHDLYSSWWYLLLIALIGVSLVICSIDRVVPLYKALKNQGVTRHERFMKRQRLYSITKDVTDEELARVTKQLESKRYNIRMENGNILAEKGRFSRWGPYVNHVGLIIFLIGGMLRFVPGMYVDKVLWLREGETKAIPGTNDEYYLKNNEFTLEVYDKDKDKAVFKDALESIDKTIAKNYQSDLVLYKAEERTVGAEPTLTEVKEESIRVNQPLKFDGYAVYQVDYKADELSKMSFYLEDKTTKEKLGDITVDLNNPESSYDLGNGNKVEIVEYFPDFYFNENGEPNTKTPIPNNPAFVFKMYTKDKPNGEMSFVGIMQTIESDTSDNQYKMAFKGVEMRDVSGLTVRLDNTLWILAIGGFIFMVGVIQGMYWHHRRIWIQRINDEIVLAGYTNKNWFSFTKEIDQVLEGTSIVRPEDQKKKN
ncbi:cytochrome c biogenesis protein ResB [Priestia taiwanensis]|uniref:Cytochrome c biogenesis protein n=1 Tax=Priestia taiwanensis TaxID=1347902 RepID=A0A917AIX1_9BACI|nr:cytochrome c biogenesis protein ResB [Priestia taiwanensis]MBM7361563.1 cytochrome c biogenesis protein [Priestia taiwanensis]GGE55193.1 cytochrome c biogenesis protein [Priestia taiwanensis]